MTRYKVVITEIGQEKRTVGATWEQGAGEGDEWGYTPEIEATRDYEREVFRQELKELDLPKLVLAINAPTQQSEE